jgi:signal transduction histidine kinase
VARCARNGEPVWLESYGAYAAAFPEFAKQTRTLPKHDAELAIAALPLTIQGRTIGALGIAFTGQHLFDEPERAFLTVLAQHCAEGLERARLYHEAQAAEQRSRFLARASALLASSLDPEKTLRNLADLVVPQMADWCAVELVGNDGTTTSQVVVKHVDPSKVELAQLLREKRPPDPTRASGVLHVIQTGEPELYETISDQQLAASSVDPEHYRMVRSLGLTSAMIVPMRAHGRTFGAITFVCAESGRRFDAADLAAASQVGERAGVALHNASVYQQAVTAVELRDEFLSVAGHELRTPLTALLLQAQALVRYAEESPDPARARQRAERLTRNATRLSKLVDELLDVTRISSGRLQLSLERIDLKETVQEVVQGASEQIERARSVVRLSASESVCGLWDRHRIEQVTLNLLSNALKYGGEQPIDIAVSRSDGHAILSVRDHGMGISLEDQQRIFGRFERAVSSRNFGGLGLGLWLARQIVEAHGGSISVWSGESEGAEFTVRLPLSAAQ